MLVQALLMIMFDQIHLVKLFNRRSIFRIDLQANLHKLLNNRGYLVPDWLREVE